MRSVIPEWISLLSMQQQCVLMLAGRGPDGVGKHHPCKPVVHAYRACVFKAAYYGRELRWGEQADGFMTKHIFGHDPDWNAAMATFFAHVDELPHHYYMHLMHGAQILGYHHPHGPTLRRWLQFYMKCCEDLLVQPETEEQMDNRLSDWHREHWDMSKL